MTESNTSGFGKFIKRTLYAGLLGATIAGTYFGREGDFPPIYVNKTGTSGGICVGLLVHSDINSKFYGPVFSLYSANEGTINGTRVSAVNDSTNTSSKMNGLEVGLINSHLNGDKKHSTWGSNEQLNGVAIGVGNVHRANNSVQFGLINILDNGLAATKERYGLLINGSFDEDLEQKK